MAKGIRTTNEDLRALILNEVGGGVDSCTLDVVVGKGYAANDSFEAWAVDRKEQFRDYETGESYQILTSWSLSPVNLTGEKKSAIDKAAISAIAEDKLLEMINYIEENDDAGTRSKWLERAMFLSVGAVIAIVVWRLLATGTLSFSGLM